MRRYVQGIVLLAAACALAMTASCRRTQPSLIDRNQPPDTQLWYAPPDSTDYEYIVHMYWRGIDSDGTARRFIWAIQDTIAGQGLSWNPALRIRDYRIGRITSRTDSVFSFTAYKDVAGVGVRKNRQAFFVAAIDDNGVIDPEPAAVEFVATIAQLPQMHFTNYIDDIAIPYVFRDPPSDTVGMYRPLAISYHGTTVNGQVRGYMYFPLSTSIVIPGAGLWTSDLGDTLRDEGPFENTPSDHLPAGTFRFAARCIDDAGAESPVDAGAFRRGVSQVVVNFDPDTWITDARSKTFYQSRPIRDVPIDFNDNVPDTVPDKSWVYFSYYAHDDRRDGQLCSVADPDECINFNVRYVTRSTHTGSSGENSGFLPRQGFHDSDPNSTADSNTVNIASFEYDLYAVGVDENETRDGTAPFITVVGNFGPSLDTFAMTDQFGVPVNTSAIDTLEWNFYKGIGWPYDEEADTVQTDGRYYKLFGFNFSATGHDHPLDQENSTIGTWRYQTYTGFNSLSDRGTLVHIGRGGIASWFPGDAPNQMTETVSMRFRYDEADGDDFPVPEYANQVVTLVFVGRDAPLISPPFEQYVFWDLVPTGQKAGSGVSTKNLVNFKFGMQDLARWTPFKVVQFYLRFTR